LPAHDTQKGENSTANHRFFAFPGFGEKSVRDILRPMTDPKFLLSTYAFHLPDDRIAQTAAHPPESARMLVCDRAGRDFEDRKFSDLADLAGSDRLFVFNDSRVIPCRVAFESAEFTNREGLRREKAGEVFFLRGLADGAFEALVFPGPAFSVGSTVKIGEFTLEVVSKVPDGRVLRIVSGQTVEDFLHAKGKLPLPPYVEYSDEKARDYQTDFARKDGSLAAPTASLHFTDALIGRLRAAGSKTRFLTLHVGLGTFKPVKVSDIRDHDMHSENFEVPLSIFRDVAEAKREGRKVVGVGTTVTRTLESLPYLWPHVRERFAGEGEVVDFWDGVRSELSASDLPKGHERVERFRSDSEMGSPVSFFGADASTAYGSTAIFVYPGGRTFRVIDEMVTNFHLPESTLFMLVSAFLGIEKAHEAYAHALSTGYRFYSFGDGMWLR
jgi:S-adenosylmethionine:tRNA ribosyltransferase-isomerase